METFRILNQWKIHVQLGDAKEHFLSLAAGKLEYEFWNESKVISKTARVPHGSSGWTVPFCIRILAVNDECQLLMTCE